MKSVNITTKAIFLIIQIIFVSNIADAAIRCSTDKFNVTTCRDDSGITYVGTPDKFGNTTWRDNRGGVVREYSDPFGHTTYRNNNGDIIKCTKDKFNKTVCRRYH